MKLNLALVAAVAAEWNGQNSDSTCGMQLSGPSMVNSTCYVTGPNIKLMYAGNGAFIAEGTYVYEGNAGDVFVAGVLTGFDGVSGDADVVVFFEQDCSTGECDNSTCWDASIACTDNGAAASEVMFMETVNANQAGMLNLQIANADPNTSYLITLDDNDGNNVGLTNITSNGGEVSATEADGSFSITTSDNFGDLLQVSVNTDAAVNLFKSTVA